MTLNRDLIEASFSTVYLERGRKLAKDGHVGSVELQPDGLTGVVVGAQGDHYKVRVAPLKMPRRSRLSSMCTCPVGQDCKHGAALCLAALEMIERGDLVEGPTDLTEPPRPVKAKLPGPVEGWLQSIERIFSPTSPPPEGGHSAWYLFTANPNDFLTVTICHASEGWPQPRPLQRGSSPDKALLASLTTEDRDIWWELDAGCRETGYTTKEYQLKGPSGELLLQKIIATQRSSFGQDRVSSWGPEEEAEFSWDVDEEGLVTLYALSESGPRIRAASLIRLNPFVRFDPVSGAFTRLRCGWDGRTAEALAKAPDIRLEDLAAARARLEEAGFPPGLLPQAKVKVVTKKATPTPRLKGDVRQAVYEGYYSRHPRIQEWIPNVLLAFDYEGLTFAKDETERRKFDGESLIIYRRDTAFEGECEKALQRGGWTSSYSEWKGLSKKWNGWAMLPDRWGDAGHLARLARWLREEAPQLQAQGWTIEITQPWTLVDSGDLDLAVEVKEVEGGARVQLKGWADGKEVPLAPLIARVKAFPVKKGDQQPPVLVQVSEGAMMLLNPSRLAKTLQLLEESLGQGLEKGQVLEVPRRDLARLAFLKEGEVRAWIPPSIRALSSHLARDEEIPPQEPHPSFGATLRPYQKQGLGWMVFLKDNDFHGILADDMGLGKTVQVLALIHMEKEEGRLQKPSLVVCPTSVLPNWRKEAEKFAPSLRVGVLHGGGRDEVLAQAGDYDLLLTTYSLLARDKQPLEGMGFSMIFADESQAVKNPSTASSKALRSLKADFRMALSGTPIENSLAELWSIFDFLMPGFLGNQTQFQKSYRAASLESRKALAQKVRPFVLRRTREQVLHELPPRIEIVEEVEMEPWQQEAYDRLSLAADKSVRELLLSKGLQGGRFEILEILLRMRQACLDPRLIPGDALGDRMGAKLARLVDMVDVLLSEGRKILIFSQFTSFLDLIEEAFKAQGWKWEALRGDTRDRSRPVERFQSGESPLFLISLKAGGAGLNLTAADTVILCDPWWNPAVEDQATGRAHRMGQTRSVTVFRLITSGTVEERMLELQAHKKDLASSITEEAEMGGLTAEEFLYAITGSRS